MIYLKKNKQLMDDESYIYGRDEDKNILIPIHDFETFASICPRCGKIIDVEIDVVKDILEEDGEFENVNVYCETCGKIVRKNKDQ